MQTAGGEGTPEHSQTTQAACALPGAHLGLVFLPTAWVLRVQSRPFFRPLQMSQ